MCFYIDDKLLLIKSILKMHFQNAYNQCQPLFSNKAIFKIVINIKDHPFNPCNPCSKTLNSYELTLNSKLSTLN